jgi:hypothetical protein
MQIQLDLVSSKLQEQGGLIGNVYTDSVIPAGFSPTTSTGFASRRISRHG